MTAAAIGAATSQIVTILLDDPAVDRLRTVSRLLRLGERYGAGGWKPPASVPSSSASQAT